MSSSEITVTASSANESEPEWLFLQCPECAGSGEIYDGVTCAECDGTGKVETPVEPITLEDLDNG